MHTHTRARVQQHRLMKTKVFFICLLAHFHFLKIVRFAKVNSGWCNAQCALECISQVVRNIGRLHTQIPMRLFQR